MKIYIVFNPLQTLMKYGLSHLYNSIIIDIEKSIIKVRIDNIFFLIAKKRVQFNKINRGS